MKFFQRKKWKKIHCRLKKTFDEVDGIRFDGSIVVPSSSKDLQKDLPRRYYHFAYLWQVGRSCGRVSSERVAVVDCEDRDEDTHRRLGEPEPFFSFLPALPIDRNRRVQLVERRFGTAFSPGVTYDEDLRGSVHEWIHETLRARGVKDEVIIARLSTALATISTLRSRNPRIAAACAAEKPGRFRSGTFN